MHPAAKPSISFMVLVLLSSHILKADEHWIVSQHDHGPCVLQDFGEEPDGATQGLRLWFGQRLTLKCSFHVSHLELGRHLIDAGGTIANDNIETPGFYSYNVAFFDAKNNLVACSGDGLTDIPWKMGRPVPITDKPRQLIRTMPLPVDAHTSVSQYKTAYHESSAPIGALEANRHRVTKRPEGDWTPGQAESAQVKRSPEPRLLFADLPKGVSAYTVDGICALSNTPIPDSEELIAKAPPITVGTKANAIARVYLRTRDERLKVHYSFKNYTKQVLHQTLYVAFFDSEGRLIAGTFYEGETPANATCPTVFVNGVAHPDPIFFGSGNSLTVPKGDHKLISSYKMTLYVHNEPIGSIDER